MTDRVLTGTRVRKRRLDIGLRQADLAARLGISASYLNLIEHNRRRISGKLMQGLSDVLQVDAAFLEDGTAEAVLGPLREAAAAFPAAAVEEGRAEDLVARFPDWAALIAAQQARIAQLEARGRALSDRLAHDTQIAHSLHEVISTATAIRSTATILAETPDLDPDWQARFHGNIDTDSARLARSSQALLGFLDMELETTAEDVATPMEEAEAVMGRRAHYIPEAELGQVPSFETGPDLATRAILDDWASRLAQDAAALPLAPFEQAARAMGYDPARLAGRFSVPLPLILRRLAHLPPDADHPLMGLAECDAAGVVTFQKPILDFRLARAGAACPLWPLFQALTQPGRALRRIVRLPGAARTPFECFAVAGPVGDVAFGQEPRIHATMLVRPAQGDFQLDTVGPGCRVCSVEKCSARRHPSLV